MDAEDARFEQRRTNEEGDYPTNVDNQDGPDWESQIIGNDYDHQIEGEKFSQREN